MRSGTMIWRGVIEAYREYLPVTEQTPVVTLLEGNTPLIPAKNLMKRVGVDVELFFKFEGLNPTASFKDRGMTVAVSKAVEERAEAVAKIFSGVRFLRPYAEPVSHHHSRFDSDGISLESRIIAVAEAYAAMTSPRGYRPAMKPDEALKLLHQEAGGRFDPLLVQTLSELIPPAPDAKRSGFWRG